MKVQLTKQIVEFDRKEILSFISDIEETSSNQEETLRKLAILRKEINKKTEV